MAHGGRNAGKARQIYQDLLDRITQAYWSNDFDEMVKMINVPHKVSSFGPILPIKTQDDLRRLFDEIRNYLEINQITEYHRVCLVAQFKADDEIEGMHETRPIAGAQLIEEPFPVKSVLRIIGGNWMVCESDNALEPHRGLGRVFNEHQARQAKLSGPDNGQDSKKGNSADD